MTTGYVDPNFPIPEPDFLFVHPLVIHPVGPSEDVTVDDEGRWRYSEGASVAFTGYLTAPNRTDNRRGNAEDSRIDAVALASRTIDFPWPAFLEAADPSIPPLLRGWYRVQPPRPNPSHVRLLLTRLPNDPRPNRAP